MADVAALAGVSGQTVSRVANRHPRVDATTRARVEAAMAELGYRPHRAARALRTGRSQSIGVVVATLATVGNTRMLEAVSGAASTKGYALVVVSPTDRSGLDGAFTTLRDQGVDGAIVLNEATALARGAELPRALDLVVVDSPPDQRFAVVESDHAGGAHIATAHLLALGHPTVWHLGGPETSYAAAEREAGWRAALEEAGIVAPPVIRGDWSAASGHVAGLELAPRPDVSALFVANDQMALGLLRAVHGEGRSVPGEVSVIGFDDVADAADYTPPLTTVRQDFDTLGQRAVEALVARIEGGPIAEPAQGEEPAVLPPLLRDVVPTRLVVRESTGPAASVAP
ncbi:LacI family DNA-binding transcriptional regulator [Microbacterium sp. DT81.1]|uniref:LacI family DNA-binding transcriptional regulator n=1 Tax=Microbacterium sp. DT81.1 TaxID=3393413 RepID=UPI003CF72C69